MIPSLDMLRDSVNGAAARFEPRAPELRNRCDGDAHVVSVDFRASAINNLRVWRPHCIRICAMRVLLLAALLARFSGARPTMRPTRTSIPSTPLNPLYLSLRPSARRLEQLHQVRNGCAGRTKIRSGTNATSLANESPMTCTARSSIGLKKGHQPEHVKVVYDAPRSIEADADVTKLAYHFEAGLDERGAERLRCRPV